MMSEIARILNESKTVAVVGISEKPDRPSHRVAEYLKRAGYKVIPVNPTLTEVLGQKCYPDLESIPGKIDVVDVFRKPETVMPVVESAIKVGAKTVWMQEGIINEDAARRATDAGLNVVMDRCMLKEHKKMKDKTA